MHGAPIHTLVRGRFVMRDGQLVVDASGWGQSVKGVQRMPTPKPRNTEHYTSAVLKTPAGVPRTAVPTDLSAFEGSGYVPPAPKEAA